MVQCVVLVEEERGIVIIIIMARLLAATRHNSSNSNSNSNSNSSHTHRLSSRDSAASIMETAATHHHVSTSWMNQKSSASGKESAGAVPPFKSNKQPSHNHHHNNNLIKGCTSTEDIIQIVQQMRRRSSLSRGAPSSSSLARTRSHDESRSLASSSSTTTRPYHHQRGRPPPQGNHRPRSNHQNHHLTNQPRPFTTSTTSPETPRLYSVDGEVIASYLVEVNTDGAGSDRREIDRTTEYLLHGGLPTVPSRFLYNESLQQDIVEDFNMVTYQEDGEELDEELDEQDKDPPENHHPSAEEGTVDRLTRQVSYLSTASTLESTHKSSSSHTSKSSTRKAASMPSTQATSLPNHHHHQQHHHQHHSAPADLRRDGSITIHPKVNSTGSSNLTSPLPTTSSMNPVSPTRPSFFCHAGLPAWLEAPLDGPPQLAAAVMPVTPESQSSTGGGSTWNASPARRQRPYPSSRNVLDCTASIDDASSLLADPTLTTRHGYRDHDNDDDDDDEYDVDDGDTFQSEGDTLYLSTSVHPVGCVAALEGILEGIYDNHRAYGEDDSDDDDDDDDDDGTEDTSLAADRYRPRRQSTPYYPAPSSRHHRRHHHHHHHRNHYRSSPQSARRNQPSGRPARSYPLPQPSVGGDDDEDGDDETDAGFFSDMDDSYAATTLTPMGHRSTAGSDTDTSFFR